MASECSNPGEVETLGGAPLSQASSARPALTSAPDARLSRAERRLVTAGVMLAFALAALEATVVSTALPTVVGELRGLSLLPWVTAIYLLTSTTTVPIYGRLADFYGRRPTIMVGIGLFLLGSILCGAAQSMEQLILFRAVQGIGAGAVQPIALTIVGDSYSLEERARVQGLFSLVWGTASVFGPLLGAFLTQFWTWRLVFYINLPFGLLAAYVLWRYLRENVQRRRHQIDYIGTIALTIGVSALLLGLLTGGQEWAWLSWPTAALFGSAAVVLGVFGWWETRVAEPAVPLNLFRNRLVAVASLGATLIGFNLFGLTVYIPLFVQGAQNASASTAALGLGPMLLAWSLTATFSGRLILRFGYRPIVIVGTALVVGGAALLTQVQVETPLGWTMLATGLTGTGLGLCNVSYVISVQNAVPWSLRGLATATNQFVRTIGGTLGVAILGSVVNNVIADRVASLRLGDSGLAASEAANRLLDPVARASLPEPVRAGLSAAVADGLHAAFLVLFAVSLIGLVIVFWFPRGKAGDLGYQQPEA